MEDTWEDSKDVSRARRLRDDSEAIFDGCGSTADDDTSNISEEGNTEEESSNVLTPSVNITAQAGFHTEGGGNPPLV